ncbi:hypothetical protein ACFLZ8_05315 [Planctomycetota bacterium]
MLKLHFAYLGNKVTCNNVKPFLPVLSDSRLGVRIPTPITVHLDNCSQCQKDMQTIADINLNRIQLYRLSQLFSVDFTDKSISCNEAKNEIIAFVLMAFNEIDEKTIKHLCTCPKCRQAVSNYRDIVLKELHREKGQGKCSYCKELRFCDIYDYCLPYGINSALNEQSRFHNTLVSHMRSCPACMEKIQELHCVIVHIAEHPESEIATIYQIEKTARHNKESYNPENLYVGFPINVRVASRKKNAHAGKPNLRLNFTAALKRQFSTLNIKPFLKAGLTGIAAVAMILIAVTFFLNAPSANAISIEQVYKAIENSQNVHIKNFAIRGNELVQETWISSPLNVYLSKSNDYFVMWDIFNKDLITIRLDTGSTAIQTPTDEMITDMEKNIAGKLGIIPFYYTEIPEGAQWNLVTNNESQSQITGTELYELIWQTATNSESLLHNKQLYFVEKKSGLPIRIESYRKIDFEEEQDFEYQTLIEFEYPSNNEIKAVLEDFFSLLEKYSTSVTIGDEYFHNYPLFFEQVNYRLLNN